MKPLAPISDLPSIRQIEEQRGAFKVTLASFSKTLVRPPGKEKDFLPRYNRVVLNICKTRQVPLKNLTVIIHRNGTRVGKDNKEYLTVEVGEMKIGFEQKVEGFVFDPFNLPFDNIEIEFCPEIELGTNMRSKFIEIREFL